MSPALVLEGETPRLIDEWQEVPPLWDAVRYTVDQRGKKGQFILTGSATPKRKGVLHSGAGRIGKLRMRPMSLYESGDSSGKVSLQELCEGKLTPAITGDVDLRALARLTVRGGWPGNMDIDDAYISLLPSEYLDAVIDDDVNRVDETRRDKASRRIHHQIERPACRTEALTKAGIAHEDVRDPVALDHERAGKGLTAAAVNDQSILDQRTHQPSPPIAPHPRQRRLTPLPR